MTKALSVKGLNKFKLDLEKVSLRARSAMTQVAIQAAKVSEINVPRDTGELDGSLAGGHISSNINEHVVGFGYNADYAQKVNDSPEWNQQRVDRLKRYKATGKPKTRALFGTDRYYDDGLNVIENDEIIEQEFVKAVEDKSYTVTRSPKAEYHGEGTPARELV